MMSKPVDIDLLLLSLQQDSRWDISTYSGPDLANYYYLSHPDVDPRVRIRVCEYIFWRSISVNVSGLSRKDCKTLVRAIDRILEMRRNKKKQQGLQSVIEYLQNWKGQS
jgi:hypothetical protein